MLRRKGFWGRALRKPPRVIVVRGSQEVRIHLLAYSGGWKRLERRVRAFWTRERVMRAYAEAAPVVVVARDAARAIRRLADADPARGAALVSLGQRLRDRRFAVLGSPVPNAGPWPWHSDWRWGKDWAPRFFRTYDPYEARSVPFDVKMPWELSRMTFLMPMVQAAALGDDASFRDEVGSILEDWERANPLAYSVNWHPMEASMRGIGLAMLIGMLRGAGARDHALCATVARMAATHGEFIARTVEYTDLRGNHYMANVVALLTLGLCLQAVYPRARRWVRRGARELPAECRAQFHPDGVDFEGSMAYHRFVAELALVGMLAMERNGFVVDPAAKSRIHLACRHVAACRRPDGLLPNIGDNDSAMVFAWDPEPPRDPAALLAVGRHVFGDGALDPRDGAPVPAAVAWVLGEKPLTDPGVDTPRGEPRRCTYTPDGGVVVGRERAHYVCVDVGGVGLAGRGGHGHNDLGSFELAVDGSPLVIDSGCPVYSGDPALRDRFRGTAAHNTLRVDGLEMARFAGLWGILDDARPVGVRVMEDEDGLEVRVAHHGYRRLPDPVDVSRTIMFSFAEPALRCVDSIRARAGHTVERFLHLHPSVAVIRADGKVLLAGRTRRWLFSWTPACEIVVHQGACSPEYGVMEKNAVIVLRSDVLGFQELQFAITPFAEQDEGRAEHQGKPTLHSGV